MENFIKFILTNQSKRSESFMFLWRIIMAVLMTNYKMNQLGYYFDNKEVSFSSMLNFLFSSTFPYVLFYYLIFIFIFFWGVKVLVIIQIAVLKFYKITTNKNDLFTILEFFGITKNYNGNWYIKNKDGLEFFKKYCKLVDNYKSIHSKQVFSVLNVLISTYLWYHSMSKSVIALIYVDTFLLFLLIFLIILTLCFFAAIATGDNINEFLTEYNEKEFFNDIVLEK